MRCFVIKSVYYNHQFVGPIFNVYTINAPYFDIFSHFTCLGFFLHLYMICLNGIIICHLLIVFTVYYTIMRRVSNQIGRYE